MPLYPSKCCELGSVPRLFLLPLFSTWTHILVFQGVGSASTYIWFEKYGVSTRMNDVGQTLMDGRGWMDGRTLINGCWRMLDKIVKDIGQNKMNGIATNVEWNGNGTMPTIDGDNAVEQSTSASCTTMMCRKFFFFFLLCVFIYLFFFLFFHVATRATHYMTTSSKT